MDLATSHLNADLDGVASAVALTLLDPPLELALPGGMDATSARFWADHAADLPALIPVRDLRHRLEHESLGRLRVGDTADPSRLGVLGEFAARFADVRCWDNHPEGPGDLPRAPMPAVGACTSALVAALHAAGVQPSPAAAGLFLLGIHVDTGHFTFRGSSAGDHEAAARCLAWGADPELVGRYVPRGFSARQLALLESMADAPTWVEAGGRTIPLLALELGSFEPDLSDLLEQLRAAERWPVVLLLVTQGGNVAVLGRGDGSVDLSSVLRALGGGGHPEAASAVLHGVALHDAIVLVRDTLMAALEHRRTAADLAVRQVVSLPAETPIASVADALFHHRINAMPLTEGQGDTLRVVGLVSRQEVDAALRHQLGAHPAREISAGPPAWISPDTSLAVARRRILSDGRRLVAVGSPERPPLGILTRGTLFRDWEAEDLGRPDSGDPLAPAQVQHLLRRGLGRRLPSLLALGALGVERGTPVYLVGGCVRDLLLARAPKDIDVVVQGDAPAFAAAASRRFGGHTHTHDAFATARWACDGLVVDLASARVEYYEAPAALPQVLRAEIRRDLYRRDFTINAMAVSLTPDTLGTVLDPYGGARDLSQGLLRVLHGLSFHDDPTRAFRAARFAARFDFRLAPQTASLLQHARRAGVLSALGRERLGAEMEHILGELEVVQAVRLLRDWDLLGLVHAKLASCADLLDHLALVAAAARQMRGLGVAVRAQDALWLVLADAVPAEARADLLRLVPGGRAAHQRWMTGPERVREALAALWGSAQPSDAGRALQRLDEAERTFALGVARNPRAEGWIAWWEQTGRSLRTAVDGDALIAAGLSPGPALGQALRVAQERAWDGAPPEAQLDAALASQNLTRCGT